MCSFLSGCEPSWAASVLVCDCFYNPTGNLTLSIPFKAAHSKTRFKLAMQQLSAVGVLLRCLKLFGDYFKIEWKPSIGIVIFLNGLVLIILVKL